MFEINEFTSLIQDDGFSYIDNFYKNPDEVVTWLKKRTPSYHKEAEYPSYNGIHFADFRHDITDPDWTKTLELLESKLNLKAQNRNVNTNMITFFENDFNDFKNNVWFPHVDRAKYNAIIFLNKEETPGTNLYELLDKNYDVYKRPFEHYKPWESRKIWRVAKNIKSCYNRLILFESHRWHGMAIEDKTFFDNNFRLNQVVFFE